MTTFCAKREALHGPCKAGRQCAPNQRGRGVNAIVKQTQILPPQDSAAIEIGDLYRRGKSSMVDSVRYLIEAGQRLTAKKDSLKHGEWLPWLEANADALGFDNRSTAQRLMNAAKRANGALTHHLNEEQAAVIGREIWGNTGG